MAEAFGVDAARLKIVVFRLCGPPRVHLGLAVRPPAALRQSDALLLNQGIEYLFMAVVGGAGACGARSWAQR
jgi:hypothetical protein